MTTYRKHLNQPWFDLVKTGRKTVEGRLAKKDWAKIKIGDQIVFFHQADQEITLKVVEVNRYQTFAELIESQGLEQVLPGVEAENAQEAAEKVYLKIYSADQEKEFGVVGIKLG